MLTQTNTHLEHNLQTTSHLSSIFPREIFITLSYQNCHVWLICLLTVRWNLFNWCNCIVSSWNPVFQPSLSRRARMPLSRSISSIRAQLIRIRCNKWQSTSLLGVTYTVLGVTFTVLGVTLTGGELFMMRAFHIIVAPCLVVLSLQVWVFHHNFSHLISIKSWKSCTYFVRNPICVL